MRRSARWFGMVLVIPLFGGAGGESSTPDGDGAACTVTVKARRDPGTGGAGTMQLAFDVKQSKVRIKSGTWSQLGTSSDPGLVNFAEDGSWRQLYPSRSGTGEWSGQFQLKMGCRYNRRYEFTINRLQDRYTVANTVRPQYPSASTWTTSQTVNLGSLAKYF